MKLHVGKLIKKGKPLMLKSRGKQLTLLEMDLKRIHTLSILKTKSLQKQLQKKSLAKSLNGNYNQTS
jgi:hypothetical protein